MIIYQMNGKHKKKLPKFPASEFTLQLKEVKKNKKKNTVAISLAKTSETLFPMPYRFWNQNCLKKVT